VCRQHLEEWKPVGWGGVSVHAYTWFVLVCVCDICVCICILQFVYTSVIIATCLCCMLQFFIVKWNQKERKTQSPPITVFKCGPESQLESKKKVCSFKNQVYHFHSIKTITKMQQGAKLTTTSTRQRNVFVIVGRSHNIMLCLVKSSLLISLVLICYLRLQNVSVTSWLTAVINSWLGWAGVWAGTPYCSSTPGSLLWRVWLQMTSPAQDGSACIWDILASFLCSGSKWRHIFMYRHCLRSRRSEGFYPQRCLLSKANRPSDLIW